MGVNVSAVEAVKLRSCPRDTSYTDRGRVRGKQPLTDGLVGFIRDAWSATVELLVDPLQGCEDHRGGNQCMMPETGMEPQQHCRAFGGARILMKWKKFGGM